MDDLVARAGGKAKTIKPADLIDNCQDIVTHDWPRKTVRLVRRVEALSGPETGNETRKRLGARPDQNAAGADGGLGSVCRRTQGGRPPPVEIMLKSSLRKGLGVSGEWTSQPRENL